MSMNLEPFKALIAQLMSTDNEERKQAEVSFNDAKSNPSLLTMALLHLIRQPGEQVIRLLCCVLLRKLIGRSSESLWATLDAQTQGQIKAALLDAIEAEKDAQICLKLGDAAAQLGEALISHGEWNELLPFLFKLSKGEQESHREVALQVFAQLAPELDDLMRPHFPLLKEVLQNGLNDPQSLKVRIAALAATANFLQVLPEPEHRVHFQQLTPLMLGCVSAALNASQEEEARSAIELFVDMAEVDPTFLKPNLQIIVPAMQTISTASNLEDATRHLGLEFLVTLAESKPGMIRRIPKYVETLVPILLNMMLDMEDDPDWYTGKDDDDVDITNADVGEESLDRLSIAAGGQVIVPVLFGILPSFFNHADWKYRHTALMAISIIGEGCQKQLEGNIGEVLKSVVPFFRDSHPRVRWAACNSVGQMATDFGPDFQLKFHADVLPNLVTVMDDRDHPRVQSHAASAVINFCEVAVPEVLTPYLDGIVSKLLALLRDGKVIVQEQAVTALASIADCIKKDFIKYYDAVVPMLKAVLSSGLTKEYRTLRGKAMECVTLIGVAVGKEKFLQDAKDIMELLSHTQSAKLDSDDPQVSFLLQAWARICRCLGQDFVPFLAHVMPPLLKSARMSPDVQVTNEGDVDPEGWDFIAVGDKRIGIHTSALEEKSTACNMLFCYALELEEGFFPYVDEVAKLLVPLMRFYYHDGVRSAATTAMPHLLVSAKKYFEKNPAASGADTMYLRNLWSFILPTFLESLQETGKVASDLEMLVASIEALTECLQALGDNCLDQEQMGKVIEMVATLIDGIFNRRRERITRRKEEDHDEEEEEKISEEEERDQEIMSQLAEFVGHCVKYCKQSFMPFFDQLVPRVNDMLKPESQASDRQSALCIYCDLVDHMGNASTSYFPNFLHSMMSYVADSDVAVRQAAVYGLGAAVQHGGDYIKPAISEILTRLTQMISSPDSRNEANANPTENAISAVGKIIAYHPGSIDAATATTWLSWLPVTEDKIESKVTYNNLCGFIESSNTLVLGQGFENVPKIVSIFGYIVGTDLVDEDLVKRIVRALQQMQSGMPAQVLQGAWAGLSQEQQQKLQQFMAAVQQQ